MRLPYWRRGDEVAGSQSIIDLRDLDTRITNSHIYSYEDT